VLRGIASYTSMDRWRGQRGVNSMQRAKRAEFADHILGDVLHGEL
jgi:hypothetical protein